MLPSSNLARIADLNVSHEEFTKAIELYDRAMKTRDALEFKNAVALFEEANRLLEAVDTGIPLLIGFTYDMALAYDLAGDTDRALVLFKKTAALYHHFCEDHPEDPAVGGFSGLLWGVNDYLSLWETAHVTDSHYLDFVLKRRWNKAKMPLKVVVDKNNDTGFDTTLSEIIFDGFEAWTKEASGLSWKRASRRDDADIFVTRVSDGLGSAGGHTAFEDAVDESGEPQLQSATIRISMHSPDSTVYTEPQLRALKALAIHEAGHAFGLDGHSPHATDLMYWKSPLLVLSKRDLKTFRMLYE